MFVFTTANHLCGKTKGSLLTISCNFWDCVKIAKELDITNLPCFILVRLTQVAGAAAASGLSLTDVAAEAKHASEMVGTMGVALSVCTLPGQVASDRLGSGKMELGLGIVSRISKEALGLSTLLQNSLKRYSCVVVLLKRPFVVQTVPFISFLYYCIVTNNGFYFSMGNQVLL